MLPVGGIGPVRLDCGEIPVDYGKITITADTDEIPGFRTLWAAAEARTRFHTLGLEDYLGVPVDDGTYRRLVLHQAVEGGPDLILPCIGITRTHRFAIGSRVLFSMNVSAMNLINPWILEGHPPKAIAAALSALLKKTGSDILTTNEIPVESALARAMAHLSWPAACLPINKSETLHWLTELPDDFEDYIAGLSKSPKRNARNCIRRLPEAFDMEVEVLTDETQVDRFLEEAERINRTTYQWHAGQRLENTPENQAHFRKLAREGRFRSYLLTLDGVPQAFARSRTERGVFLYELPGYNPELRKHSIGIALLMLMKKDLIENTDIRLFDFGMGGGDTGVKAEFGNLSIPCNAFYVVHLGRPRGLVLWALQGTLNRLKAGVDRLVSPELKQKLRKRLRKD